MSHHGNLRTCGILIALAAAISCCSKEPEYTDRQRACIAEHFGTYNATKLNQCVDVCKTCMSGTTATCNTSCKLKGAS